MNIQPRPLAHRILPLLLGLACGFSALTAPAALTDPAQIQTEAYVNLVQADQSLDAGRLDEALAQYKVARDYYLQLAKDFPGWEPRVIQYRKTYCDNQIADVEHRQSGGQPEELPELAPEPIPEPTAPAPEAVIAAAPEAEPAPATDRSVEIDYLKSRITSLESELAEIDTLQGEIITVSAENDKLRQDLDAANQQIADKSSGEQAALEGLRAELAAKDDTIKALEKDLESKKQLDQALNDMEGKAHDLRAENSRLQKEVKTLDEELDDAEIRADQADLQAKQAETKAKQSETEKKDAERDLKKSRDDLADAEKELAALQRKPVAEKPAREKDEPQSEAKAESKPETKPEPKVIEKAPEMAKVEPVEEPKAEPAPESPVLATVPPKIVPDNMAAADYVRQLLQDGENDAALATVQEARKKAPADMNLLLIEGIALIRLQRYPEAATLLIDLAKNNPRNAEAHATLGAAMMGAGFYEEARETLLMAVKLDKNLPECHYNLAQLYAFVDPVDLKLARKYYKQARDLGIAPDKQIEKALK